MSVLICHKCMELAAFLTYYINISHIVLMNIAFHLDKNLFERKLAVFFILFFPNLAKSSQSHFQLPGVHESKRNQSEFDVILLIKCRFNA